jgi:hypothetical protein
MSYAWFHRPTEPGIFVYFVSPLHAYDYAKSVLLQTKDPTLVCYNWDLTIFNLEGNINVGNTPSLQVSVISDEYVPQEGWGYWNNNMTFLYLTKDETNKALADSADPQEVYDNQEWPHTNDPQGIYESSKPSCLSRLLSRIYL